MYLPNAQGQNSGDHYIYNASNTITADATAQLVLPVMKGRTLFEFFNLSAVTMYLGFGGARAHATLTGSAISSITVDNAGFGYSIAPEVQFIGGGNTGWNQNNPTFLGCGEIGYPSPSDPARAHCVMTGTAPNMSVSSIVIDNPGTYAIAPRIFLKNSKNDPFGAFLPSSTAPGSIAIPQNGSYRLNGTACFIDQISVICATSTSPFSCYYMP